MILAGIRGFLRAGGAMSRRLISLRVLVCARFAIIAAMLALASPLWAEATMGLTMYGTVTSVDGGLQSKFHTGDTFQFGFTIDPAEIFDITYGVRINARNLYFKIGPSYAGSSYTEYGEIYFHHDTIGDGPTGQGINFEKNNMIAPAVNGLPLSELYLDLGLNDVFDTRQIREQQLLALNGQPILNTENVVAYNGPAYRYVRFNIDSIVVLVPEPAGVLLMLGVGVVLNRRPARGYASDQETSCQN
jgi:hypothetical protein